MRIKSGSVEKEQSAPIKCNIMTPQVQSTMNEPNSVDTVRVHVSADFRQGVGSQRLQGGLAGMQGQGAVWGRTVSIKYP